jgi:hypothetical protein
LPSQAQAKTQIPGEPERQASRCIRQQRDGVHDPTFDMD